MGFDDFDMWVLIGLMVARILMGGLLMMEARVLIIDGGWVLIGLIVSGF